MARLARWAIAGLAHHVLLLAHNGRPVINDERDRGLFLDALRAAAEQHRVAVHGVALPAEGAHLLLRPAEAASLSATVQTLGRRFVAAYNARHGRTGTPWNGRFRAAPLQPGAPVLLSLRLLAMLAEEGDPLHAPRWTPESAWWTDPPELWALGNTPFEREQAYGVLVREPVAAVERERLLTFVRRGLPVGDAAFLVDLEAAAGRPARARARGRPARR